MKELDDLKAVEKDCGGYVSKDKYKAITENTDKTSLDQLIKKFGTFTNAKILAGLEVKAKSAIKSITHNPREKVFCKYCADNEICKRDIRNCEYYDYIDDFFKIKNFVG